MNMRMTSSNLPKKREIKIIIESSKKLNGVYELLDDFVINLCEKYELNYYELFGLLESLKLNYDNELQNAEE